MSKLWCLVWLVGFAAASLGTVHPLQPGMSIQAAVNNAQEGDTVLLYEGDYLETVILYGKDLTIGSLYLLDGDTCHVEATTISAYHPGGMDTASCFVYAYGETNWSRLSGLTLRYGSGTFYRENGGWETWGGGVFVRNASLRMDHCRVMLCFARMGGGAALIGDSAIASLEAEACIFQDCWAFSSWGGGVAEYLGHLSLANCAFRNNQADVTGSAAYAVGGSAVLRDCAFTENLGWGPAVALAADSQVVTGCHFFDNRATVEETDLHIKVEGWQTARVTGCLFESSEWSPDEAILLEEYGGPIEFVGNVIRNYSAYWGSGKLLLNNFRFGDFSHNLFVNNANRCSPIYVFGSSDIRLHHNVFVENRLVGNPEIQGGSALSVLYPARASLDSNWFAGNSGPLIRAVPPDCHLGDTLLAENNWWGDASGPYHADLNPTGQGDTLCNDNVDFDPWLTAPPDTSLPSSLSPNHPGEIPSTWQLLACYPNPFNSALTLDVAGFTGPDFEVVLYNALGQQVDVVHRGAITGGQLLYQAPPHLASGVYLLSAHDKHGVQTKKVVLLK